MSEFESITRYIRFVDAPEPAELGEDVQAMLRWLGGPALIRIPGADRSRCRGVSTLLHGNEPSGAIAVHRLLRQGLEPATDVLFFFGAVEAALEPPLFSNRMLAGVRDLNRCFFPPFSDHQGRIAQELLFLLQRAGCESLVDIHNNSGRNPAYGIVTIMDAEHIGLVSLFALRCIHSELRLGTLTEATTDKLTSVTIECGRSGDPAADDVAFEGLQRYTRTRELAAAGRGPMTVYECPIRVSLADEIDVTFAREPSPAHHLTLSPDLEDFNFQQVDAGTPIGYLAEGSPWPLEVRAEDGGDVSNDYFEVVGNQLRLSKRVVPTMMTCNAELARADCLCYLVRTR